MNKILKNFTAFFLIFSLNLAGILAIGDTFAYFSDVEGVDNNSISTAKLDFYLSSGGEFSPDPIKIGESSSRQVEVKRENESLDFQYNVSAVKTGGDEELCNALNLKAELDGVEKYNAKLKDFNLSSVLFSTTTGNNWNFTLALSADATNTSELLEKTCEFKFIFLGRQLDFPDASQGFSDEEEINNTISLVGEEEPEEEETFSGYAPIIDSYIDEDKENKNYGTNAELFVKSQKSNKNNRSLVKFDFHLPTGTNIISSFLKMYLKDAPNDPRDYEAIRILDSWQEYLVNWKNQPNIFGSFTDKVSTGNANPKWLSFNVLSDVQNFVNMTYANYGWLIKDSAENSNTTYLGKFHSRESASQAKRPVLEITFNLPEITTSHLVINEVYYHIAAGKGNDLKNEWVEIYNPTGSAVDISNWQICDNNSCNIIPVSTPIPAKGFAVITGNASTWSKWTLPSEAIEIVVPGGKIGNGLINTGDRVILKDNSDNLVDAMSYGSDVSQLNPSVYLSGKGKSLARVIKGYDNDAASDWIINAYPNPGTNPSNGGVETLTFTADGVAMNVDLTEPDWEELLPVEETLAEEEMIIEEEITNIEEEITNKETGIENQENTEEQNNLSEESEEAGVLGFGNATSNATSTETAIDITTNATATEETIDNESPSGVSAGNPISDNQETTENGNENIITEQGEEGGEPQPQENPAENPSGSEIVVDNGNQEEAIVPEPQTGITEENNNFNNSNDSGNSADSGATEAASQDSSSQDSGVESSLKEAGASSGSETAVSSGETSGGETQ